MGHLEVLRRVGECRVGGVAPIERGEQAPDQQLPLVVELQARAVAIGEASVR